MQDARGRRLFVTTKEGLYRSADSGATWTHVSKALTDQDIEAVVVSSSGKVFLGSFEGGSSAPTAATSGSQ